MEGASLNTSVNNWTDDWVHRYILSSLVSLFIAICYRRSTFNIHDIKRMKDFKSIGI